MSAIHVLSWFFTQGPKRVPGSSGVAKTALSGDSVKIGGGGGGGGASMDKPITAK